MKRALLVLAVAGVLLGGCGAPADPEPGQPLVGDLATTTAAPDLITTTEPATEPATAATSATATATATATTAAAVIPKPAVTVPKPKPTTVKPKPKPATKKPSPKPTTKPAAGAVHPGAFCSPEGATGHTVKGTKMRCTRKAGEDQARWRAA